MSEKGREGVDKYIECLRKKERERERKRERERERERGEMKRGDKEREREIVIGCRNLCKPLKIVWV